MSTTSTDGSPEHSELLSRGVVEVLGEDELHERLARGEKLRIKLGIDPTSTHVHLGRSVALLKLRDFQQLGHTVVFIVGDFTGVIGDTSDKESERPMLDQATVDENKQAYLAQVGKLIDLSTAEFHYNSEWLGKLTYREIGEHADQFSVADFIARENIRKRLEAGKRVSLREMLYPLMQGYDSVAVRADVELGGTDQRFNILAGRTLESHFEMPPQAVIMNPLIPGLDGRKMSSSWGNTINLDDEPVDMYGKLMSLRDELVPTYFELCTRVDRTDLATQAQELAQGTRHPRDVKMRLAREIVTLYHGAEAAIAAEAAFVHTFQNKQTPDEMLEVHALAGAGLADTLKDAGVVASGSEWRRLVDGGGVYHVDNDQATRVTDVHERVHGPMTVKIGKRRFVRIIL
jgi:tyrosyl-tRNA synthetase